MNFFEIFDLPLAFSIDLKALRARYIELSRELHPDRHAADLVAGQVAATQSSALVNDAYETLRNPERRTAYILTEAGLLGGDAKPELPPDFLMETLELNESLADAAGNASAMQEVLQQIDTMEAQLNATLAAAQAHFDGETDAQKRSAALQAVLAAHLQRKYLLRLRAQHSNFAAH